MLTVVFFSFHMANREKNKKALLELAKLQENSSCADCGAPGEVLLFSRFIVEEKFKMLFQRRIKVAGCDVYWVFFTVCWVYC